MDEFVARHLQGVSRTYAIVVPMLPPELAGPVGLAYLVMRIVDTIEDDPSLASDARRLWFEQLEHALSGDRGAAEALSRPLGATPDERALMADAAAVFARLDATVEPHRTAIRAGARAMSAGVQSLMARSAERGLPYPAVRDLAELREYCYYVAGVVGEMLCAMMAHHLREPAVADRRELAVELGTGLQLVNILKDAPADAAHGRRYLPMVTGGPGVAGDIYAEALAEAQRCLALGVEYVLALPSGASGVRMFCGLPIVWGALTLARAAQDPHAAKIERAAIAASIERFTELASDDVALATWLRPLIGAANVPDKLRTR